MLSYTLYFYLSTQDCMHFESLPSHAPALRIHMSDSTANILTNLGGYHIEKRGQREVKVQEEKIPRHKFSEYEFGWAFNALRS